MAKSNLPHTRIQKLLVRNLLVSGFFTQPRLLETFVLPQRPSMAACPTHIPQSSLVRQSASSLSGSWLRVLHTSNSHPAYGSSHRRNRDHNNALSHSDSAAVINYMVYISCSSTGSVTLQLKLYMIIKLRQQQLYHLLVKYCTGLASPVAMRLQLLYRTFRRVWSINHL